MPELTVRGLPEPPSLHVKVPITPVAVMVDVPQLLITLKTGALGFEVTLTLMDEDVAEHPLDVTTTV